MCSYKLRPHHSLCIRFFRGSGYSPAFVENMSRVIAALGADDPAVTLTCSADAICAACPNDRGGVCESAEKVARYDDAVARLTGLNEGDELRWSALCARVDEAILRPGRRGEVCGDCQWSDLCG